MLARRFPVADLVDRLASVPGREGRLTHLEVLPPRAARTADWPAWAAPDVVAAFTARGVRRALGTPGRGRAEAAHDGQHVVLATGTASGKSLAYQLPALSAVRAARGERGRRGATVLYLAPTKALAQDQLAGLGALGLDVRVTTHDGDSSREQRDWARDHAEYVLTNPDMLHRSLLPGHQRWARFLGSLPTSWSTSATTTGACSAPTSPTCCAGCAGSARRTARPRRSCSPRPPSPSPRSPRTG